MHYNSRKIKHTNNQIPINTVHTPEPNFKSSKTPKKQLFSVYNLYQLRKLFSKFWAQLPCLLNTPNFKWLILKSNSNLNCNFFSVN